MSLFQERTDQSLLFPPFIQNTPLRSVVLPIFVRRTANSRDEGKHPGPNICPSMTSDPENSPGPNWLPLCCPKTFRWLPTKTIKISTKWGRKIFIDRIQRMTIHSLIIVNSPQPNTPTNGIRFDIIPAKGRKHSYINWINWRRRISSRSVPSSFNESYWSQISHNFLI